MRRRDFLKSAAAVALPGRGATGTGCIFLWQGGGASHLDTFDPKPGGPFQAIPTSAPGVRISAALPRLARQMDKVTILRSMRAEDTNHERAARLIWDGLPKPVAATADTLALVTESPSLRDRYGRTPMGAECLMARRMVQRGERLVKVTCPDFDTHTGPLDRGLAEFDQALAALIEDLHERRMLDRILVVAAGEFGRTPCINAQGGRDHHAAAWSVCLAGAGVAGGRTIGATDAAGGEVVELPVSPEDLAYTICGLAGFMPPRMGLVPVNHKTLTSVLTCSHEAHY